MKNSLLIGVIGLWFGILSARAVVPGWAFAEGWFINSARWISDSEQVDKWTNGIVYTNLDPRSIAIWSGGNVDDPSNAPSASYEQGGNTQTVKLVQSAFGQIVAGPLGYVGAANDLQAKGQQSIEEGARYRYQTDVSGRPIGRKNGAYIIVFEGGPKPDDCTTAAVAPNDPTINCFPELIQNGEAAARSALRINPYDLPSARLLLRAFEEEMIPLIFAGNSALIKVTCARLLSTAAAQAEISSYATAIGYFNQAADVFRNATANPLDTRILEGVDGTFKTDLRNEVSRFVSAFGRAVAQRAESILEQTMLRHNTSFRDPRQPGVTARTNLLQSLASQTDLLRSDLLVGSALTSEGMEADLSKARAYFNDFGRLRAAITGGRILFASGLKSNATPERRYAEYTVEYVPFFGADPNDTRNNFQQCYDLANLFVSDSKVKDELAKLQVERVAQNAYDNSLAQEAVRVSYDGELIDLCGSAFNDQDGNAVPDIFFAPLSPGERELLATKILTNYPLAQKGLIYQQWQAVDQAGLELELARSDLTNTVLEMAKRQEIGEKISGGQRRIAYLILENGEKVVALDKEAGEAEAQLALALAEINARLAKKQGRNALFGGIISTLGSTISGAANPEHPIVGGIGGFLQGAGSTYTAVQNAYASAEAARASGNVQADAARRLADIQAQKDKIVSLERAEIQFESANEADLRLEEALYSLTLQAARQRLVVLLAIQKMDQEETKLSRLFARVGYLLAEYRRAVVLRDQNPAVAPDYRIYRDSVVRDADGALDLARQWVFLTALALDYKDNRPNSEKTDYLSATLSAQTGSALGNILLSLSNSYAELRGDYNRSVAAKPLRVSLRNDIFQHNRPTNRGCLDSTNILDLCYTNAFVFEPTFQGTNFLASDESWLRILQSRLVTNSDRSVTLSLPFDTNLERLIKDNEQRNPLFDRTLFGLLIFSGRDQNGRQFNGVRVNVVLKGVVQGGTFQGGDRAAIAVDLKQQGLSFVRRSAWACDDLQSGLRLFNLSRFTGRVDASINNIAALEGTTAFQERSAANSSWVLNINNQNSANNRLLLNNLALLKDIELEFSLLGFQDQNCF